MNKTEKILQVKIDDLIPYVNNARTHSKEQIRKLRSSLREFGFVNPVLIDKDKNIIAGHGRVMAGKEEGLKEVPCVLVEHLSETQKKAYILADKRLADDAGWDEALLKIEFESLGDMEFDLLLTGFSDFDTSVSQESEYTKKIDTPTYEKKDENAPEIFELIDKTKYYEIIKEIEILNFDNELKEFLIDSAKRLYCFNYEKIAEFYCHQNAETQEIMEKLALVIIDFEKAIEYGYAEFSKKIKETFEEDYGE